MEVVVFKFEFVFQFDFGFGPALQSLNCFYELLNLNLVKFIIALGRHVWFPYFDSDFGVSPLD